MPRFAVYYVPPKESEFYRLGSQIVGYDVRAHNLVEAEEDFHILHFWIPIQRITTIDWYVFSTECLDDFHTSLLIQSAY